MKLFPHLPYSPDCFHVIFLIPSNQKRTEGKKVENLARAVQAVVEGIPKEDYENYFQNWRNRLERCIEFNGEYFEGMN